MLRSSTSSTAAGDAAKIAKGRATIETAVVVAGEGKGTDRTEGVEILASGRGETTNLMISSAQR